VLVNGRRLATTFGTEGAEWHWQDGGVVEVTAETRVALHDLTGFEGRLFADCTGDATVGFLVDADHETSKEGVMGASNLWNLVDTANPAEVLRCECKDKDAFTITVDQSKAPRGDHGFHSLGRFRFEAGKESAVLFQAEGAQGVLHIDAIQIVEAR
jgi:hypothetical protein